MIFIIHKFQLFLLIKSLSFLNHPPVGERIGENETSQAVFPPVTIERDARDHIFGSDESFSFGRRAGKFVFTSV